MQARIAGGSELGRDLHAITLSNAMT